MNLKVGDVVKVFHRYTAVVTKVPDRRFEDEYSFMYYDGSVDEENFTDDDVEVIGYVDGVDEILKEIRNA